MPAKVPKHGQKTNEYYHVFNKGVEDKGIFLENDDCEVFIGYLSEYLSPPADPENTKKVFTVNGRTYSGVPHQPNNYNEDLELVGYSLKPDHFHLVLIDHSNGAISKFMRSLCTRYSMYFNRKYQRKGSLFSGPFKSASVETKDVLPLISFIHTHNRGFPDTNYSSHKEYTRERNTSWIKVDESQGGTAEYNSLSSSGNINLPKNILFDEFVEETVPVSPEALVPNEISSATNTSSVKKAAGKPRSKLPEFIGLSSAGFVLLFSIGLRNIWAHSANSTSDVIAIESHETLSSSPVIEQATPPVVASAEDSQPEEVTVIAPAPSPKPKVMLKIKITDGSKFANIRREPTADSEILGELYDGEIYELVSEIDGWYRFKLTDGSAYVSSEYAEIESEEMVNE